MFFERELYHDLIKWAQRPDRALFLEGPRQVGKTELLLKLGREQFKNYIHIDVKTEGKKLERLMEYHKEQFGRSVPPEETTPIWEAVFKDMNDMYTNDPDTLVILDEIQELPLAYNTIRSFRRSLKSRLAVSGSYLGIIYQNDEYWYSAGDITHRKLSSFSFKEFLQANGIWDEYSKVKTFDLAQMTDAEREICEQVRELYRVYCQIGGYPAVVRNWIDYKEIDSCKEIAGDLLRRLYDESSSYFGEMVGIRLWSNTLERLTEGIVTKSGDLDIKIAKEDFRDSDSKGLHIRRKDKVNALKWLSDCGIIDTVSVYNMLNSVCTLGNKHHFYLRDMGFFTRLSTTSINILPSNIAGMMAENFVFLHLSNMLEKEFAEPSVRSFDGTWGQIDFIMHNQNRRRFGIEVKHGSGETKSGDKALAEGKIDYLIRIQDTYGSVSDNQATIPIFMLDKLSMIVTS
jgi:predicted AAA+ superfamily ATPase